MACGLLCVCVCVRACARVCECTCVILEWLSGGFGLSPQPTRGLGSMFKSQEPHPPWAAVEPSRWEGGGGIRLTGDNLVPPFTFPQLCTLLPSLLYRERN